VAELQVFLAFPSNTATLSQSLPLIAFVWFCSDLKEIEMRRLLSLLLVCFATIVVVAQAPSASPQSSEAITASQTSTQTDKATVYVYRYRSFEGGALVPSVFCDDAQLARIQNGRYFTVKVSPGKHTFQSNDKQSGVAVDLKPGEEYFLRVEIAAGLMKGHGRLLAVMPEQGRFDLQSKKMKPVDEDKVSDKERVSTAPVTFAEEKASKIGGGAR
jgi:Protein of unknown function (DUF2846)